MYLTHVQVSKWLWNKQRKIYFSCLDCDLSRCMLLLAFVFFFGWILSCHFSFSFPPPPLQFGLFFPSSYLLPSLDPPFFTSYFVLICFCVSFVRKLAFVFYFSFRLLFLSFVLFFLLPFFLFLYLFSSLSFFLSFSFSVSINPFICLCLYRISFFLLLLFFHSIFLLPFLLFPTAVCHFRLGYIRSRPTVPVQI